MATATKAKKATKKVSAKATKTVNKSTNVAKKINNSLVNTTKGAIDTTVKNGEKWQKLASKMIKKSETVREKQINMVFDTAEAVKGQMNDGAQRMMHLVGYDASTVEKAIDYATNNPLAKKVKGIASTVQHKVAKNPMVQKVESTSESIAAKGKAKFNEIKGNALSKAAKFINKTEDTLEDVSKDLKKEAKTATKKAAKTDPKTTSEAIKAKGTAEVKKAKATTKAKITKVKANVEAKVVAKEVTPKQAKKEVAKKVANIKETGTTKVKAVKTVTKTAVKTIAKDDLKLIYGIGPKTELLLNDNGINTYSDMAKTDVTKLEAMLEKADGTFAADDAKDWIKQAEVAVKDGAEGLEKWVARYRTA